MTGCLFGVLALVAVTFLILLGVAFSSDRSGGPEPHSVLHISLAGNFTERATDAAPFDRLLGWSDNMQGLEQLKRAIRQSRKDPDICGIYLECGRLSGLHPAMLDELRQELDSFKRSGKFVTAYADHYTQGGYYVISHADKVILNPQGTLQWKGLSTELVFYKELLGKLGIEMQVFKVGDYKSAVEPFTATEMSAANREQITSYMQSIWDGMVHAVAEARSLSGEKVNRLADEYTAFAPAEQIRTWGLVDTLAYRDELKTILGQQVRAAGGDKLHLVDVDTYLEHDSFRRPGTGQATVAVYYACGDIVDEPAGGIDECIHAATVCRDLKQLREDDRVKAVVLRINSGGGSAYASEQIWREVELLQQCKPVVASMSGLAASGGYYIACAAGTIVAQPMTLTGSIGIFGMFPDAGGLLRDKLGLHFDRVKTNVAADMGSPSRPFDPGEREAVQAFVERGYDLFVKRVELGRGLPADSVKMLARGRVWTGRQACENGLVDWLGGLDTAVRLAAEQAGLKNYALQSLPEDAAWYERWWGDRQTGYMNDRLLDALGDRYRDIMFVKSLCGQYGLQARLPYVPNLIN